MIVDRSHRTWAFVTLALTVVATVVYILYARTAPGGPSGGSVLGLWFGVLGSALMILAGLLSGRKKVPRWQGLGSAEFWLRGHIWLGLLSGPLILFHAGFRWGGLIEQILLAVFGLVYFSGIVGLLLQQYLPRVLSVTVPAQAIFEQLPSACVALIGEADRTIAGACGTLVDDPAVTDEYRAEDSLRRFYVREIRPGLAWQAARPSNETRLKMQFRELKRNLPSDLWPSVDRLQDIHAERRRLDLQRRLHYWLHGWLFVHLPLSVILLIVGLAHAVVSVWY